MPTAHRSCLRVITLVLPPQGEQSEWESLPLGCPLWVESGHTWTSANSQKWSLWYSNYETLFRGPDRGVGQQFHVDIWLRP